MSALVSYFNQIKNILFKDLKHLTDLQLHGGHWTSSEMDKLIQAVGGRLHNLGKINGKYYVFLSQYYFLFSGLISVKGLDIFSLKAIFSVCDNLNGIVFNNCDFRLDFISLMRDGKFRIFSKFFLVLSLVGFML